LVIKTDTAKKIAGLALALLLIGWFVGLSMFKYKRLTGYWQYSPFSGWLLANNAMYAYQKVDSSDREPVPLKFRALDNMIRNFYDTLPNLPIGVASTAYMWTPSFPLRRYNDSLFKKDTAATLLKKWASMGPLYGSYGLFIIKKYPLHFLRYYVWPNSLKYLAPPVEFLDRYNSGKPTVRRSAVKWFGYKDNKVKTSMKNGKVWILQDYPFFISITNLIMLLGFLSYLLLKGWQYSPSFNKIILLAGFVWIMNAVFNIFTCTAALRFQAFPAFVTVIFSLLLIDWMARLMHRMKLQNQQQNESEYLTVPQHH
jgi:hypothetical protein